MPLPAPYTKHIIDSLPGIFYVFDATGKFILWNKNLEQVSGYTAEEISTMHPIEFFDCREREAISQRIEEVFTSGNSEVEAHLLSKANVSTPYFFNGTLTQVEEKPCLIGMGIDISMRVEAEALLRKSEERYRQIVETAQEGIWLIDENNITILVNNQMARMLGYSREEMIDQPMHSFMEKEEYALANKNVERRKQGFSDEHEFVFKKKNGEHLWTLLHTNPIIENGIYKGALAMIIDITEHKLAERQLKYSEQKFKSLIQNGSDLVAIIDEKGYYSYISPTITNILGYEPNFLIDKNAFDFIHPEDKTTIFREFSEFLKGKALVSSPYRFLHQNGQWRWLESRGSNLFNDPAICGLVINSHDITERIRLQEELDRRNKENQKEITAAVITAQENERSQLGQELHDNVNQVLTTVKLYNEMLRDGLGNPKNLIEKSMFHLQNCIDEIRSISKRLSAPTLGNIALQDSIKELVESINLVKRISIVYTIEGYVNQIASQELHLAVYRIVQEQLNNIIKYAEASFASIEISTKENRLYLIIKDDGRGFDITTKREGIGITNMKTRAENLNGNFEIITAPGKGCTIRVDIPIPEPIPA